MNFSRVQWNVDVKDNTYVKRTDENGNVSRKTTGYGLRPASSIFIIRSCGLSSSSPRTARMLHATAPFRRTSIANGSSASCITQKYSVLRQPAPTAAASMNCRKRLDAYAPNDWNKSVKDLGYTIETTSRTYLISCPSADRAHLLLLYSNGKVEKNLHFKRIISVSS